MNGINNIEVNNIEFPDGSTISSASNLVQLDTNNNFTGNNTYNTNLPTSDVNPDLVDINNNTMLNRFSADKLYSADTNDYITAFSRDGTTGIITLTQADTGTPITSKNYTSITDNEITAIGTNTGAISTLTTNLNPCFKSASIDGQTLTLTPVSGTATGLTLPTGGGANAVLKDGGTAEDPQILSGVNRINVESEPNNTGDAINQFYADANYGDKLDFGFVQTNDIVPTADIPNISIGQPSASNPNQYGGALFMLSVDITPIKQGAKVLCNYSLVGEWERDSWDNMTYIAVATKNNDNTYTYNRVLRAVGSGNRSAGISGFNIKFHVDNQSTVEQSTGQFIDQSSSLNANQTYRFTPVIVNTGGLNPKKFYMNRTKIDGNSFAYERGCSSFIVQVLGYS
tara:strand:+ start:66 stop:1262 length:1197 start_codon:yes stop_codon:yes gene_type:complete